jgi:hypothetical protein
VALADGDRTSRSPRAFLRAAVQDLAALVATLQKRGGVVQVVVGARIHAVSRAASALLEFDQGVGGYARRSRRCCIRRRCAALRIPCVEQGARIDGAGKGVSIPAARCAARGRRSEEIAVADRQGSANAARRRWERCSGTSSSLRGSIKAGLAHCWPCGYTRTRLWRGVGVGGRHEDGRRDSGYRRGWGVSTTGSTRGCARSRRGDARRVGSDRRLR